MTDRDESNPAPPTGKSETEESEERSVRSILRRARVGAHHDVDLLGGVQRRIRERSRGRFYRDGWSRRDAATSTLLLTSLLMLIILLLVYFVLLPSVRFR
jgi:hypothetical protein